MNKNIINVFGRWIDVSRIISITEPKLAESATWRVYISFDIDALDEKYASATGTPEKNGLLPTDCAALIRLLSKDFKITGADLMEVAPFVWPDGVEARDQQSSMTVAGDMARVLLECLKA